MNSFVAAAALLGLSAVSAHAGPLIAFTDNSPGGSQEGFLSDTHSNWAVGWSQAGSSSNVSVQAIIESNVGATTASWYITDAIGPGATAADVIYSGSYSPSTTHGSENYNLSPRKTLATGLTFGPGTYYLVLDGPAGPYTNNASWVGDTASTVTYAPGFAITSYYACCGRPDTTPFAPANAFQSIDVHLVLELSEQPARVPAPGALALLGLSSLSLAVRRRG